MRDNSLWWACLVVACIVGIMGGPEQAINVLMPRVPAQDVIRASMGRDVMLEDVVRIRPRSLGPRGQRMAFGRTVVCGNAVTQSGRVRVAVVYPLRRSSNRPSVVTATNPGGSQNEGGFIGSAILAECADARDWKRSANDRLRKAAERAKTAIGGGAAS